MLPLRSILMRGLPALTLCAMAALPAAAQDSSTVAIRPGNGKWSATIGSFNNPERGAAELRVEPKGPKEARARLAVRNVAINRQLTWDVVAGSCGDEGAPVAARAAFRSMLTRNDGTGDAMATIPVLEPGKRYYVRVFAQGSQITDRTALGCANLSES
jgi:hypothetical protein